MIIRLYHEVLSEVSLSSLKKQCLLEKIDAGSKK